MMRADVPADKAHLFYGRDSQLDAGRCLRDDSLSFRRDDWSSNRQHRAHAHAHDEEISVVVVLAGIAAEGPSQLPETSSGVKSRLNAR